MPEKSKGGQQLKDLAAGQYRANVGLVGVCYRLKCSSSKAILKSQPPIPVSVT